MKILLDENLPHKLRHELLGHDVFTVQYQGWSGLKNGALLAQAAASGFEAMVTMTCIPWFRRCWRRSRAWSRARLSVSDREEIPLRSG